MARRDKEGEKDLARARIDELCQLADQAARAGKRAQADRAVDVARRLAERHQVGYPPGLKTRMRPAVPPM